MIVCLFCFHFVQAIENHFTKCIFISLFLRTYVTDKSAPKPYNFVDEAYNFFASHNPLDPGLSRGLIVVVKILNVVKKEGGGVYVCPRINSLHTSLHFNFIHISFHLILHFIFPKPGCWHQSHVFFLCDTRPPL